MLPLHYIGKFLPVSNLYFPYGGNTVKDKIVALPTMYVWKMMNMGEVDIKGVEVNLSTQFRLPLRMSLLLASTYSFIVY